MKHIIKLLISPEIRFRIMLFFRNRSKEKEFISKFLPANPVIIEAGAHNGFDSVSICKQWERCTLYAFEPIPSIYVQLVANTKYLKNVKTFPLALSTETGESKIFVSSGGQNASSSLLPPKEHVTLHPEVSFDETITIKTINLDEWARQNKIDKIDFMWLDMQGFELAVLKSSPNMLKTVSVIYTEVHILETYEGVPLYDEIKLFLENEGFELKLEELEYEEGGNALFVRVKN